MGVIFSNEKLSELLYNYYVEHYGERESDVWYESPAVNVVVFRRENKYVSLKAHILTGNVE